MSALEPTPERLSATPLKLLAATRPAFLSVTVAGCVVGWGAVRYDAGELSAPRALLTLVLALLAHAAINAANDYYDARNGCDAVNDTRVFPFTGGSRLIPNGVLSERAMAAWAACLATLTVIGGIALTVWAGPGLLVIGALGLAVGWSYSAPPLWLAARGLGEIAVTAGFLLVVLGAYFVQHEAIGLTPVLAGTVYAMMVANILYANQIPDAPADARSGKRTLVVRLGVARAHHVYALLLVGAALLLCGSVWRGALPTSTLAALLAFALAANAWQLLRQQSRAGIERAIPRTIGAALGVGAALGGALALSASA